MAYGYSGVNWAVVGGKIALPLLLSPIVALIVTTVVLRAWKYFATPSGNIGEWELLPPRQQKLLAALQEVLLIKRPRIHEVLQHDHDHVLGDIADGEALGQATSLAGEGQLLGPISASPLLKKRTTAPQAPTSPPD